MKRTEPNTLIHCITNPISMMQCANTVLGLGARPIMAEHPLEVQEITGTADALLINLGNISDSRMEAMEISFAEAVSKDIPVVIDAVGVACSQLRRDFLKKLLKKKAESTFLVLKGNYSEIMALFDENYRSEGVDAKEGISAEKICEVAGKLSKETGAIILASGKSDVVTNGERAVFVQNGCPQLSMITGTGCMLGAICATLLSTGRNMGSVADACALLGIAGEMAAENEEEVGSGTFLIRLLDNISLMNEELLENRKRIENHGGVDT